ncbi:MAG: CPBP family intramembrane metalloprotease [Anaerolineaceae bacterium]|nr:CPBP family intramembrane metalloprotease [Anaerolineaceae bacterium]
MVNLLKRYPLTAFFILAFLFSWAIYLPLIFVRQGWMGANIPYWIHYLGSFGPALASFLMTALIGGKEGLRELWSRITHWRVNWKYGFFAIFSTILFFALCLPVMRLVRGEWPDLRLLGEVNYLPYLGIWALPLWVFTFGFGEEIGWRGFALPRLQKKMPVLSATLVLGVLWILWHVPTFFYHVTYIGMGWNILPAFTIGVLSGAVLFTWLYNGTGGSVLMVALWHGLFDFFTASTAGGNLIPMVISIAVILWAVILVIVKRPWGVRFQPKQTL